MRESAHSTPFPRSRGVDELGSLGTIFRSSSTTASVSCAKSRSVSGQSRPSVCSIHSRPLWRCFRPAPATASMRSCCSIRRCFRPEASRRELRALEAIWPPTNSWRTTRWCERACRAMVRFASCPRPLLRFSARRVLTAKPKEGTWEISIEGLWIVSYEGVPGDCRGVVVLTSSKFLGGESAWYYEGTYHTDRE